MIQTLTHREGIPFLVVCTMAEERSDYMTNFDFYKERLSACPSYGFICGHDMLKMITRCAFWDSTLTTTEFNSIIKCAELAHIKMMEDNYNAGWQDK